MQSTRSDLDSLPCLGHFPARGTMGVWSTHPCIHRLQTRMSSNRACLEGRRSGVAAVIVDGCRPSMQNRGTGRCVPMDVPMHVPMDVPMHVAMDESMMYRCM